MKREGGFEKKKIFIGVILITILIGIFFILNNNEELEKRNINTISNKGIITQSQLDLSPYDVQPDQLSSYQITIENGLKISYDDWYVTFQPYFVMNSGQVFAWNDIPSSINKELKKEKVDWNKYHYYAEFSNISQNVRDNLRYIVLHRSDFQNLTLSDINITGNSIIIKDEVVISHNDLLRDYSIVKINKTDIVIGNIQGKNITTITFDNSGNVTNTTIVFKNNFLYDNLTNSYSIVFDPTITLIGDTSYASIDTNVTQESGFAHLNISTTAPYDSLVLYMPFDSNVSSTTTYDYSKYNNDGTVNGNAFFNSSGFIGGAYEFDGTGDYIDLGDPNEFDALRYTFMFWIKGYSAPSTSVGVVFDSSKRQISFAWGHTSASFRQACSHRDSNGYDSAKLTSTLSADTWYHIACTYDGSNFRAYLNGVNEATTGANDPLTSSGTSQIGAAGGGEAFPGTIDEFMFFNISLSTAQILAIYDNNSARFSSTGDQLFNDTNVSGDGTENRLNISLADYQNELLSNISVEINTTWFNISSDGTINNLEFTADPNILNITFRYIAGNNSFYSPLMIGNITLDSWTVSGADSTPPTFTDINNITINNITALSINFNATDETAFDSFLINDTTNFIINRSGFFQNNTQLIVKQYFINVTINDTTNNLASTVIWVNVTEFEDTINPNVTINTPLNQTYNTTTIDFNITALDETAMGTCWYSLTGGTVNYTMGQLSNNWNATNSTMSQGSHVVNFYCNDTNNNINDSESVAFFIDSINPAVTSLTEPTDPSTYTSGASYQFNATITDTNLLTILFEFNLINYTPSVSGSVYNQSILGLSVGTYTYRWFANDTLGNYNNTEEGTFTINQVVPQGSISGGGIFEYPYESTITGTETNSGDADVTYTLFRDNVSVSNPETITLEVGFYNYIFNTTGGVNYTTNLSIGTTTLNITQNNSLVLSLSLVPSATETFGTETNATGSDCPSELTCNLYREGVSVTNSDIQTLGAGTYNYTYNTTGNANYSFNSISSILTINQAVPEATLTNNTARTLTYGSAFNFTISETNTGDVDVSYLVFRDNTDVTSEENLDIVLGVASYSYILNTTGGINWSANLSMDNYTVTINQDVPQGSISGTSPIDYLVAGNVQGSETNTGDADVTYTLFRDNVSVSNPDTTVLGAGTYEYIYNTTGGVNWSDNLSIGTFTLTVSRIASEVNLTLNSSESNITIDDETTILLNGTLITGDSSATLELYNNGTRINSGTNEVSNSTLFSNLGLHNITVIYLQSENYTQSSETYYVNVTSTVDSTPPTFDNLRSFNHTVNTSFSDSITATDPSGIDTYLLNDTTIFTINSANGLITNVTNLSTIKIYHLNISVNDTVGNLVSGIFYINITEVISAVVVNIKELFPNDDKIPLIKGKVPYMQLNKTLHF